MTAMNLDILSQKWQEAAEWERLCLAEWKKATPQDKAAAAELGSAAQEATRAAMFAWRAEQEAVLFARLVEIVYEDETQQA
jgi:hypothetical protein